MTGRGRRITAAGAAAAVLLLAGCGGAEEAPSDGAVPTSPASTLPSSVDTGVVTVPPTAPSPQAPAPGSTTPGVTTGEDVTEVRAVLRRYIDAFVAADGATACALLTEESSDAFLAAVGSSVGATTCADAFAAVTRQVPQEQRDAFRSGVIDRLTVSGDTAAGRLTVVGVSNDFRLVRRFGEWRIANLPGQ